MYLIINVNIKMHWGRSERKEFPNSVTEKSIWLSAAIFFRITIRRY